MGKAHDLIPCHSYSVKEFRRSAKHFSGVLGVENPSKGFSGAARRLSFVCVENNLILGLDICAFALCAALFIDSSKCSVIINILNHYDRNTFVFAALRGAVP